MSKAAELANLIGNINAGGGGANKNFIINGNLSCSQRGTSAVTINSGSATYRLDRFYASGASSAGVFTVEQSTDAPTDFKNSLKVTVTTADSSIGSTTNYRVNQNIEGQNISSLNYGSSNAKTVTLSFYVKSSLTGTFGGKLGNSDRDRSHPFTYTISSANTWEQKTVTITGDTSGTWLDTNGIGFELVWSIGAGADRLGTAGTWAGVRYDGASGQTNIIATNSSTWLITGVQLEVGQNATSFEHEPFDRTLEKCHRYYEIIKPLGVVNGVFGFGGYYNSTLVFLDVQYKHKRTASPSLEHATVTSGYLIETNGASDYFNSFTGMLRQTHTMAQLYTNSDVSGTAGMAGNCWTNSTNTFIAVEDEL